MRQPYVEPVVRELGGLASLTLSNKIGSSADAFTSLTGVVGSIVPTQ
jgi:hypothetical protein